MSFGLNQIHGYLRRGLHLKRFDPSQRLIEPRIWIYAGFIVVPAMDSNAEILIELAQLRGLSTAFSGGDRIQCSLASTLDAIVETITLSRNTLYDIT